MSSNTCSVDGCGQSTKARGLCSAHYQRWRKTGDPTKTRPSRWDGYDKPTCTVDGCDKVAHAKGLCGTHAPRARRHGDPLAGRRSEWRGPIEEFVLMFVDIREDGCWWWTGATIGEYGSVNVVGAPQQYAHRVSHAIWIGPVGNGLTVHHRCENKMCINPDHLVAMTRKEHAHEHRRLRSERSTTNEEVLSYV